MLLQIRCQNVFQHQIAESFCLCRVQVLDEVILGLRSEQTPRLGRMMVLQDGTIVVEDGLSVFGSHQEGIGPTRVVIIVHGSRRVQGHQLQGAHALGQRQCGCRAHFSMVLMLMRRRFIVGTMFVTMIGVGTCLFFVFILLFIIHLRVISAKGVYWMTGQIITAVEHIGRMDSVVIWNVPVAGFQGVEIVEEFGV